MPNEIRTTDMTASTACPMCGVSAVRYSPKQRKDGLLRLVFCSAWRCNACRHRYHRLSLWGVAAVIAIALLIATLFGVVHVMWTYY